MVLNGKTCLHVVIVNKMNMDTLTLQGGRGGEGREGRGGEGRGKAHTFNAIGK